MKAKKGCVWWRIQANVVKGHIRHSHQLTLINNPNSFLSARARDKLPQGKIMIMREEEMVVK